MTSLRLLREARSELRTVTLFYEAAQPGLGRALVHEVRRALRFVRSCPHGGRSVQADIRVRPVGRFPYRIYYRSTPDEIVVVAIGHLRRRPGYWAGRR
ncbi:MAG: type II toxin-antitoxin system RelE/ParE family toxin [Gammaproteobacteria bacterium]|nr:type II toxin-antitoxin system RelE/ParE family toxin [Gammaproteobacteria bacterium]